MISSAAVPFLVFLVGLCVGSFLNVVILRTREGASFVRGRSRCPSCAAALAPIDLVPVLSYVALRGRCRSCEAPISPQYPLVEFAAGLLALLMYVHAGGVLGIFARDVTLAAFLLVIFVYDFRYMEILDRFSVPAMVIMFLANVWLGEDPWSLVAGAGLIGGFFLVQYAVSRGRWIGAGDIRMGLLMGFALGMARGLVGLFVAYLLGALFASYLLITKKADGKTPIPFGTFLSAATVISLLWGDSLLGWYLGMIGSY